MFGSIRNRLILIGALVALSIFYLYPRNITQRERGVDGVMRDTVIRRVPLKLGLDLAGGMHLALELDQSAKVSANPAEDVQRAVQILRKRTDEFGVTEPLVQQSGDRIVVELAGIRDPGRAKAVVQKSAFLEFRITDKGGAFERALPSMDRALRSLGLGSAAGAAPKPSAVQQLLGGDSAKVESDSTDLTGGLLASLIQPANAAGIQATPGEFVVAETAFPRVDSLLNLPQVKALWPRNIELLWAGQPTNVGVNGFRMLYAVADKPIITGENLIDASAAIDPLTNGPIVRFELDRAGARKFLAETSKHINDFMAIVLDRRVQGRPPVIQGAIGKSGQITLGNQTLQEAQDLALTLRAGALPVPLKIVEERQVGATLGQDSIDGGIKAGIVGTALVILIMVAYYGLSGILAVVALGFYVLFTLAGLAMLDASLTLPGLAGMILSIGIAVDANVLIFERIRDELALGKTVRLAVDEGFKHAMPAIIDSNLTTVLTALFLFQFGTGPVQGFAVILIIGILASMLTAVFITRTMYMVWMQRRSDMKALSIGSFRPFKNANYDFLGFRRYAYIVTGVILAVGMAFLLIRGLNYSIEFTGGTLFQVKTAPSENVVARLRSGLEAQGFPGAEIQSFGGVGEYVIRARGAGTTAVADADNTEQTTAEMRRALDQVLGAGQYSIERSEAVGPKVGGELREQAVLAIILSFIAVLGYLAYRFEWRFGLAAVAATGHDILATIAFIGVMDLEVSLVVVAALLTVVGYSLNDTIVIFDRMREDLKKFPKDSFITVLNRAVNETLPRTVMTGGTALATLLALAVFGGEVIRPFAMVMFFGIFIGTFSSIFIASPVLLLIERRWPGAHARGLRHAAQPAPVPGGRKPQPAR